jgi:hypothetical protein
VLKGLSPEELKGLLLSVGSHRGSRPLSPLEVAGVLYKARHAGSSPSEIAEALQLEGTTMVGRFLRLLELAPELQLVADWGGTTATMSFSSASELGRLPMAEQRRGAEAVLAHALSSSEVKQLVQLMTRSKRGIDESITQVLRMRPTIERRHVFVGAVQSDRLRNLLASMTQSERDELLRKSIRGAFGDVRLGVRAGPSRFLIVADEAAASEVARDGHFEQRVNTALEEATAG